jgi:hypothetical protein
MLALSALHGSASIFTYSGETGSSPLAFSEKPVNKRLIAKISITRVVVKVLLLLIFFPSICFIHVLEFF